MKLSFGWIRKYFRRPQIVDHSRRRRGAERLPQHWLYVALAAAAAVGSLWQYGHPVLSCWILALLPVFGALAYVPYRVVPSWCRFSFQLVIGVGCCSWLMHRFSLNQPVDKSLIEVLGMSLLIFIMAQHSRDYGYLFAISMVLLFYGALVPRTVYLGALGAAVVLTVYLLYCNRIRQIGASFKLGNPRRLIRRNWHLIALHLGLAAGIFLVIFPLFPNEASDSDGFFMVGFQTDKDSMAPLELRQWMGQARKDAKGELVVRSGNPDSLEMSGTPVSADSKQKVSVDGGGSAPPGRDLVFRVRSPLKLYHLAQLYDRYDGTAWTATPQFKRARVASGWSAERMEAQAVVAQYTIHKWIGPKVYAPYRMVNFEERADKGTIAMGRTSFFGAEIVSREYPVLPYSYTVTSLLAGEPSVLLLEEDDDESLWDESLTRKHYHQLPAKRISKRLKELVGEITAGCGDDFDKALALRGYLRNSFKYVQFSQKVPKNRESVDFFVFDLREGHCEYFASALAVMGRIAGLPTRVATGFSPGDYNTLLNSFEVYEYHAHAWTQIFIEGCGWLTMDATPPGSIESRTTPAGIGQLRDPFGDEWRIRPPELTEHTRSTLKTILEKRRENKDAPDQIATLVVRLGQMQEDIREQLKKSYQKVTAKPVKKDASAEKKNAPPGSTLRQSLIGAVAFVFHHRWALLGGAAAMVVLGFAGRSALRRRRERRLRIDAGRQLDAAFVHWQNDEYRECIAAAYRAARLLLEFHRLPRRRNRELLAYAAAIGDENPAAGQLLRGIFFSFYEAEYCSGPPSRHAAVTALRLSRTLRSLLESKK